jgi:transketolase
MDKLSKDLFTKIANTVRAISADAIERQKSGHPGLPLGAAEIGALLFSKILRYNPKNPNWLGRDRFILSAGHGSMLLYALLHLSGYELRLDDIKQFRQLHSITPGHPEVGETPGVETTTGPLGQGVAAGTGMAIAQKLLATRFDPDLFDSKVWILAGDGCLMEGISSEAGSLAGTLGLDNLVLIYDANDVTLDGPLSDVMAENTAQRYESYGFKIMKVDGHSFEQLDDAFQDARNERVKPVLIIAKTVIGKHAPNKQGQCGIHGAYLGEEEMKLFKESIGWPDKPEFYIPEEVSSFFKDLQAYHDDIEDEWNRKLADLINSDPSKAELWNQFQNYSIPEDFDEQIWNIELKPDQPTRRYNEAIIARVGRLLPFFISGSADVASCDFTWLPESGIVAKNDWNHQQIKFGVREFCMAACAYGMRLSGMIQPAIGTFLVFSDYMRNAMRMTALMKQRVIFIFSHDSLMIAQDGPTHQPIEHLMSLRLIPGLFLFRPCDENESKAAWIAAIKIQNQPVAICFTRQPVKSMVSDLTLERSREGVMHGAYRLFETRQGEVDVEIFATGSEVHPSTEAAKNLQRKGYSTRVISVPSWEMFDLQNAAYKESIIGNGSKLKVSVEAGCGQGWEKFIGCDGLKISQETYGASAPEPVMADHFGFTAEKICEKIESRLMVMDK